MLKSLISLAFLLIVSTPGLAAEAPKPAEPYQRLTQPRPTNDPSKVEVIEFFSYGCIHCYDFEPFVKAWLKTKPDTVVFIRQPAVFQPPWKAYAKMFFTAEALGVLDKIHDDIYDAIHKKKQSLQSEGDIAKFFAEHGVKEEDFAKAFKSFSVDAKMRQAETLSPSYGITGTPTLIINGKYRVGAAKSFEQMIETANELIKQESAALPAAKPAQPETPAAQSPAQPEAPAKPADAQGAVKSKPHTKHAK